jgi:phosphatidylserine decarboxylase
MTIHKEGTLIIFTFLLLLAVMDAGIYFFFFSLPVVFWIVSGLSFIFFLLLIYFFRIPARQVIPDENKILSPADGKIVAVEETEETEYFHDRRLKVSVFMSPFHVHVNWFPVSGKVSYYHYHPGTYLVAWHPKSSEKNERTSVVIETPHSPVLLRQIAGAVARRIICYAKTGETYRQGAQLGFIRFGSRVDIFLPLGTEVNVKLNEKVRGNTTVIANF